MEKIRLTIVSVTFNEDQADKRDILVKFKRQDDIYEQTTVRENAGNNPKWNESFQINETDELMFYIYQQDANCDNLLAQSELI